MDQSTDKTTIQTNPHQKKIVLTVIAVAVGLVLAVAGIAHASQPSEGELAFLAATSSKTLTDEETLAVGYEVCENPMDYERDLGEIATETLCPDQHDEWVDGWEQRDLEAEEKAAADRAAASQAELDRICSLVPTLDIAQAANYAYNDANVMQGATFDEMAAAVASNCPEHQPIVDSIAAEVARWESGERIAGNSSYVVGTGEGQMQPGTYTTTSTTIIEGCYWEKTSGSTGAIIDNYFSSAASKVTVTVHSGETFTSNDCGQWVKVG